MKDLYTYVIGRIYDIDGKKEFKLVHPSGVSMPYYTHNPNSSTLRIGSTGCALYVVDMDNGVLKKQPDVHYEQLSLKNSLQLPLNHRLLIFYDRRSAWDIDINLVKQKQENLLRR